MERGAPTISTMRLYGSAIAIVSGGYSVFLATGGVAMTASAWGMLLLGAVVLLHGSVLLTPAAARLGAASGPLMIGYSVLMLANQAWMAVGGGSMGSGMDGSGMGTSATGMGSGATGMGTAASGMGTGIGMQASADPGMVAIAVLMLASGLIMTVRRDMP